MVYNTIYKMKHFFKKLGILGGSILTSKLPDKPKPHKPPKPPKPPIDVKEFKLKPREPAPDGGKDKDNGKGVPKKETVNFMLYKIRFISTMINTVNIFPF